MQTWFALLPNYSKKPTQILHHMQKAHEMLMGNKM